MEIEYKNQELVKNIYQVGNVISRFNITFLVAKTRYLLANGKTLYFDNVESCREVEEYDAGTFVVIRYRTRLSNKVVRFSLANENVVGYIVDKKLSRF